ncbi:bacillithiol system redox-active protein YtxJ [Croceiramulus getboli]|nr:bacillithiol system redox-active protein YtxJ [Flavobacteriaceae bacterium YJPT1-3]
MGLFGMFKSDRDLAKKEIVQVPWNYLTSEEELKAAIEVSHQTPVVIFKHSTTCGISRMALNRFESAYDVKESQLRPYFLDLKRFREISNAVAEQLEVRHESPQLLLLKNGTVVYHESHGSIDLEEVKAKL